MTLFDFFLIISAFVGGLILGGYIEWSKGNNNPPKELETETPDFQEMLTALSQIPGLSIEGPGISIKGPELKKEPGT
jgi:hypothetical protein